MFNGIIYNQGIISKLSAFKSSLKIDIKTNLQFKKKEIGSSVSCNGVCLTIVKVLKKNISFYISKETLKKSTFKKCKIGDIINLEKSLKFGDEVSGQYTQGHIDTTGAVKKINFVGKSWLIKVQIPKKFTSFIIYKGSVTINGVSLTISNVLKNSFEISIIPHTLKLTNLIKLKKNNLVNIEFDIFGKYLEKLSK
jgi:riboflavin synthase